MDKSNKKRILIAEDEMPMLKALELQMASAGYEVEAVSNGEEAISAIERESFDLIVLDLVMPIKNGFDVLGEIKAMGISTPVIVFSNLAQGDNMEKAKEFGARDFFVKSDTSLSDLADHIKKII